MCVKGKKENVEEFIKVIKADYDYGAMEFSYDRHLFRVFQADYDEIEDLGNGLFQVIIGGDCAWSVNSCMFDNSMFGYYARFKNEYGDQFRGTTLPIESKRLNLSIEVFSEECGMCFQEHYVIINGDIVENECVDFYEYYLRDYDTKEEAEAELEIEITDEDWNGPDDFISRGGFDSWDFSI
jgi:hypothetical protein